MQADAKWLTAMPTDISWSVISLAGYHHTLSPGSGLVCKLELAFFFLIVEILFL